MLREEIKKDNNNLEPLFAFNPKSKILIIGQAPGPKTKEVFKDKSGERLFTWLGISEDEFRDTSNFSVLPIDFYYPGKAKTGDLPPRKEFADKWHPLFLEQLSELQLTLLVGSYAQKYYLKDKMKKNLTETVRHYDEYLPAYFPIVHPSPLNFRWFLKNPWFEEEVVVALQSLVRKILVK